jgi:hypothetical protein
MVVLAHVLRAASCFQVKDSGWFGRPLLVMPNGPQGGLYAVLLTQCLVMGWKLRLKILTAGRAKRSEIQRYAEYAILNFQFPDGCFTARHDMPMISGKARFRSSCLSKKSRAIRTYSSGRYWYVL